MPQSTSFWDHPVEKLEEALSIRKQIAALQAKLSGLFGSSDTSTEASTPARTAGKRSVSPETRAKMVAAQRARHAKKSGPATTSAALATAPAKAANKSKKKGALTPEGRAKLSAAMKARWAARSKGVAAPNAAPAAAPAKAGKASKGKKRSLSPETRAKLAEAARLRWAQRKSAA